MQNLSQLLPQITIPTTQVQTSSKPEKWKSKLSMVQQDLAGCGLDLEPAGIATIMAMIGTRDAKKGLFLIGTPGTGKTARMRFIERFMGVRMVSASEVADVALKDSEFLPELCRYDNPRWSDTPASYLDLIIDDLGTEPVEQFDFGTKRNALADVIEARYKKYPKNYTHFTSNLSREMIQQRYGERVYSRLNEMCNFVNLLGADRRMVR